MPSPSHKRHWSMVTAAAAMLCGAPSAFADDRWLLSAEAPAALAVSDPQETWFAAGAMPSATVYRSVAPALLIGARLRVGALVAGDSTGDGLMDKGAGGLASVSGALRLRPLAGASRRRGDGLWLDVAVGPAVTGSDVRASGELGVGWGFAAGPVDLGPSLRYLHVYQPDESLSPGDASIALLGLEVTFFDRDARRAERLVAAAAPAVEPPGDSDGDGIEDPDDRCPNDAEDPDGFEDADGCPDLDNDGDRIVDTADKCPLEKETENGVEDSDGCPDQGLFVVIEDRISLDEKILFDTARARVKHTGKTVLSAIAGYVKSHPEFVRISVEGHADERGTDDFNLKLSRSRAERVKQELAGLGIAIEIDVTGYGESRPRAEGHAEGSWMQNRRVEFVLVRERQVPAGEADAAGKAAPSSSRAKEVAP